MKYRIDGKEVVVDIAGPVETGDELCLAEQDDDLARGCPWSGAGFQVAPLLDGADFNLLRQGIAGLVCAALQRAGCPVDPAGFRLEKYHEHCPDQAAHLAVIDGLRATADIANFPLDHRMLDERISEICGIPVSCKVPHQLASGYFFIRIVRPLPNRDNNPPHKDAWLDHLRNGLNLYMPLAGSNEGSSLALVPGSHHWNESDIPRTLPGALINGSSFSVPALVMEDDALEMTRPVLQQGEGLVFSPYLIHGGAVNFNPESTRVSLEMRFWRCSPP